MQHVILPEAEIILCLYLTAGAPRTARAMRVPTYCLMLH